MIYFLYTCSGMLKIFDRIIKRVKERRVQIPHWSAAVTVGMLNSLFTPRDRNLLKKNHLLDKVFFKSAFSAF